MPRTLFLLIWLLIVASPLEAQDPGIDIRRLTTPAQFEAMGLTKLSAKEVQRLNAWLGQFAVAVGEYANSSAPPAPGAKTIESKIDGDFECWDGDSVFKLMNGQIWQQTDYAYKYCYKFMPNVLIYPAGNGYKMKVDGVDGTVSVKRIR